MENEMFCHLPEHVVNQGYETGDIYHGKYALNQQPKCTFRSLQNVLKIKKHEKPKPEGIARY